MEALGKIVRGVCTSTPPNISARKAASTLLPF
jgi:hypothetical protein